MSGKKISHRKMAISETTPRKTQLLPPPPIIRTSEKKRLIPPSKRELEKQELEAKIKMLTQINRMSRKEMDSYLEDEVMS